MVGIRRSAAVLGRSKWASLTASVWIQSAVGASYCFGIYSPLLKASQGYDQSTLDTMGFFKDIGANVGILSGMLYSAAASWRRGGPWVVLLAGALQCSAGLLLVWLSVTGIIVRPPVPLMCLFMFVASHGQTFMNTSTVVAAVENFPNSRGTVVGIMKGFLGLSGAILIQICRTVLNGDPSSFLLMLAILTALIPLSLMYFVKVHHTDPSDDKRLLDAFSLIALVVAVYLMIVIIGDDILTFGLPARVITLAVFLVLLFICPIAIVIKAHLQEVKSPSRNYHKRAQLRDDSDQIGEQGWYDRLPSEKASMPSKHVVSSKVAYDADHEISRKDRTILPGDDLNPVQVMKTLNFWLLFLAMATGMGSGLATVNNISQIGASLGYSSRDVSTLVSLWSIWNFLGRFGGGYVSDCFLQSRGVARPLFIALTLAIMSVGHAFILSGFPGALHMGSVLVGVCYGCQWSLMPSITSEIFGIRHFGTIFNIIAIASPIGSYILSVRLVGYIYDMESSTSEGVLTCTGRHCFMLSFLLMASVTLVGSAVGLILFFRTRRFYSHVIFARLQASVL